MLNKIILLNSAKYQKAIISFDVNSIQIVGKNNIGKTSLISVLNFLYLPSQKDWNFDHDGVRTLNYYFKKLDKNYIIFEIFKNGYFCILIKRNDNNKLEYFKIDTSYNEVENIFLQKRGENVVLSDFETIQENLVGDIEELNDKKFKTILYGKSKRDKTIIWLSKSTQKTFSKIYKYLLNTKLITDEKLKESLLIADSKDEQVREFSSRDNQIIEDIKKHQEYIKNLESIRNDFLEFKDIANEYGAKYEKLKSLYVYFYELYNDEEKEIEEAVSILEKDKTIIQEKNLEPLRKKDSQLNRFIGAIESEINQFDKKIGNIGTEILEIEKCDPIEFINARLKEIREKRDNLDYSLKEIEIEKYSFRQIKSLIESKKRNISKIQEKIDNFENLLIHHISDDKNIKQMINSILSDEILNADKDTILSQIEKIENSSNLEIFDGKIDISSIGKKEFITIESLKEELKEENKKLKKYENILSNIQTLEKKTKDLDKIKTEIKTIENQISKIENLPNLNSQLAQLKLQKNQKQEEFSKIEKNIKNTLEDIKTNENKILEKDKKIRGYGDRQNKIQSYYKEFEDSLSDVQSDKKAKGNIDEVYKEMRELRKNLDKLKQAKESKFSYMKSNTKKEYSSEEDFIKDMEEDFLGIKDKKKSIDTLVDTVANEISKPTNDFLESLGYFKKYLVSLNTKFKKYKISNLEKIEIILHENKSLVKQLEAIASIDKKTLFQDENNQKIEILKEFITQSKKVTLSDLFDIRFVVNGVRANLKKQTESHGTDRILKITLFILIMKDLIIQDEDNKLVIYIDELGEVDDDNIKELVQRCKENNFIPIFASPDKKPHIDKYYDLIENPNSKKIIIDDNRAIYAKRI